MPRKPDSARRPATTFWLGVVVGVALMLVAIATYTALVVGPAFAQCFEQAAGAGEGAVSWSFTPWSGFRCSVEA